MGEEKTNISIGIRSDRSKGMYNVESRKQVMSSGISLKTMDVLLMSLGGLHHHLKRQVTIFKPMNFDEF